MSINGDGAPFSRGSQSGERPLALVAVLQRFPSHERLIVKFYEENDSFRDLCDDYRHTVEAVDRLESSPRQQDMEFQREYRALCLRLEHELLRYLETLDSKSPAEDQPE